MAETGLPLAGWRVLDLGIITAGAATSALLADAGAEVLKIESERYPDPFRAWMAGGNPDSVNAAYAFTNRNKLGLGLDLKTGEGRETFLALAETADVVVENFRRGVMDSLGLGWPVLSARNPRLVLASISSQGETGPDHAFTSYGSTLEATGGLAALTGYAGEGPAISGRNVNYPDQIVSLCALGLIVGAVLAARAGGRGAHLDISQRELTTFLIGETVAAAMAEPAGPGRLAARLGNGDPAGGARGVVPLAGGGWMAVELPARSGPGLDAVAAAMAGLDEAGALRWAAAQGIAAAPVHDGDRVLALTTGPGAIGHALAETPDGAVTKGFPFQSRRAPFSIRTGAPGVGEHTGAVLARLRPRAARDGPA